MSSIPFFARRRLCSTFNAQEVGLQLVPPSVEYIIYVHEDDFELAQAALQGTLN